uniref:Uncharacterized protein n=1 Tax=Anguilla anguilla TaxID=7936 RepID=A0A0E9U6F9_ANGAN
MTILDRERLKFLQDLPLQRSEISCFRATVHPISTVALTALTYCFHTPFY